ncbi:MAG: hypothetical protein ACLQT6_14960 [Desulfomonilaceae bacterium]
MEWLDRFKSMTQEQVASTMVDMISYVSPDTFLKLSFLASQLVSGENANAAVIAVLDSLREGENSQASEMFRRVMTNLSPHCLKTVAKNLFIRTPKEFIAKRRVCDQTGIFPTLHNTYQSHHAV